MTAPIDRLLALLRDAGLDLGAEEVAEAIWLAGNVRLATPAPAAEPPSPDAESSPGQVDAAPPTPEERVELSVPETPEPEPPAPEPATGTEGQVTFENVPGRPVRMPTAEALPNSRRTMHALRPLKRRRPSTRQVVVDEEATARQIAERRLWTPVWRPARERWLHLTLVLDDTSVGGVWHRLGQEVRVLLERLGAFRTMRVLHLGLGDDGAPRVVRPVGARQSLERLADRPGDHLLLVLSDCVGGPWHDGRMSALLARWGRRAPVAILQPLPERLWSRTGLSPRPGRLFAPRAGAPASAYSFEPTLRRRRPPAGSVLVPVLEVDPRWLGTWAHLVAGRAPDGIDAVVTPVGLAPRVRPDAEPAPEPSAEQRVRDFRAGASPLAFDLARYLSVAKPLNLAVMRLLQAAMVPGSRPAHLAEVLYGGLLRPAEPVSSTVSADDQHFEFLPGVRHGLRETLDRDDPERIYDLVSVYLARHAERSGALFTAIAASPVDGPGVPASADPFAGISADMLRRFTGGPDSALSLHPIRERLVVLHLREPVATVDLPGDVAPDLIVVTGGVTRRATTAEYREALQRLDTLRAGLGLPPGRIVVTPGLTDVNARLCEAYFLEQESDGLEPEPPYWPKWEPFAAMTARLPGGTSFQQHQPFQLYEFPQLQTVVAALNSTVPVSHLPGERSGGLGEAQLTWFADRLRDYEDSGWLRIGVVHHDTAEVAALAPHLDLVLHGQSGGVRELGLTGVPAAGTPERARLVDLSPGKLLVDGVTHAFGDHWWLAGDGPPPPPRPADDPGHPERTDLLARVARAYRARHPDVAMVERLRPDDSGTYLVVSPTGERHCIGVFDGAPSAEIVESFLDQVVWRERPGRDATLVCRSAAGPGLRRWALSRGVRVADFADFQVGDDVLEFAKSQAERLVGAPAYDPDLYVPPPSADGGDLLAVLRARLADPGRSGGRVLGVTGPAGSGKTFLLRELARRLHADHDPIVPVLINVAAHDWQASLTQLIVIQLVRGGIRELDRGHIEYLIEEGRFVLLCDGFDRLADPRQALDHLAQRQRAGTMPMILVSRDPTALAPGYFELSPFGTEQILDYLERRLGPERARARLDALRRDPDRLRMARNPRTLARLAGDDA